MTDKLRELVEKWRAIERDSPPSMAMATLGHAADELEAELEQLDSEVTRLRELESGVLELMVTHFTVDRSGEVVGGPGFDEAWAKLRALTQNNAVREGETSDSARLASTRLKFQNNIEANPVSRP